MVTLLVFFLLGGRAVEITAEGLTSLKNVKSTEVTVQGIRLNEDLELVLKKLPEPSGKNEEMGIFVFPHFIIKARNGKVTEISLKDSFADFIKGELVNLFRDEIFTDKEMRERLLGEEAKIEVEMIEVSKINVEKWRIIFKNGFVLEGSRKEKGFRFQFLTLTLEPHGK